LVAAAGHLRRLSSSKGRTGPVFVVAPCIWPAGATNATVQGFQTEPAPCVSHGFRAPRLPVRTRNSPRRNAHADPRLRHDPCICALEVVPPGAAGLV